MDDARAQLMVKCVSKSWFCGLLIALAPFLVWGQTVRYDFVWDDLYLVQNNQSIRSLKNIPAIFTSVTAQSSENAPSFRPLRTTFYALLYTLDGQPEPQPWIFHLASVVWHSLAAVLLFSVALLFFQRMEGADSVAARIAALLIGLGYTLNPVVSEAVCWVKCLDDLMAAVFVFASLRCLLRWSGGARGYLAAVVFYFLADLSKESAVPFAVGAFFIFVGFHKLPWQRAAKLTVPFLAAAAVYVVYRHRVIGKSEQCPPLSGSYGQTLIDMLPVATEYLRLLCGIPPFTVDYNFMVGAPPHRFFSGEVLTGLALILVVGGLACWLWRRERWRLAAFGMAWTGLFLLPVANLIPMMQYMAERFLYLPLAGFLLALGAVALNLPRRGLAGTVAGLVILVWTGLSLDRVGYWKDEVELFVRSSLDNPACVRLHENAVIAVFNLPQMRSYFALAPATHKLVIADKFDPEKAGTVLQTLTYARSAFPTEHRITMALGIYCERRGEASNAIPLLELATTQATERQGTNDPECWVELAKACVVQKDFDKARASYQTALQLDGNNVPALHAYADLCYDRREFKLALPALELLEKLEPTNVENTRRLREVQAALQR